MIYQESYNPVFFNPSIPILMQLFCLLGFLFLKVLISGDCTMLHIKHCSQTFKENIWKHFMTNDTKIFQNQLLEFSCFGVITESRVRRLAFDKTNDSLNVCSKPVISDFGVESQLV